jgi:hypothetical protein
MKEPELVQVLRTLRPGERREFREYLLRVVSAAEHALLDRLDEALSWSRGKPNPPEDGGGTGKRHLERNRLLQHLEDFLVIRHLKEDPFEYGHALARIYRQRGLPLRYRRTVRKLDRWLDQTPGQDEDALLARYRRAWLDLEAGAVETEGMVDRLRNGLQALDALFVHQKFRMSAAFFSLWRRTVQPGTVLEAGQIPLLRALLEAADGPAASPFFRLYRLQVLMECQPVEDAMLDAYREAIRDCEGALSAEERYTVHLQLINALIRKGNESTDESERRRYRQRFLRHVEALQANGVLYGLAGHLAPKLYLNVTMALVREDRLPDAERWIGEEATRLHPTRQDYYRTLATAMMYLASGEYESAIAATRDLPFDHVADTLHLRVIGLKARAELVWEAEYGGRDSGRAIERLENELKALYEYLRYHAQDMPGERGQRTRRLISILNRYWHLPVMQRKQPDALLREIESDPPIEAEWLREYLGRSGRRP